MSAKIYTGSSFSLDMLGEVVESVAVGYERL
jgi:hypothetical protein